MQASEPLMHGTMSFEYYTTIFDNNWFKINQMKNLIAKDFKQMELAFLEANQLKDIKGMRKELHKMYPIVSNLRHNNLKTLIEAYLKMNQYTDEVEAMNIELRLYLSEIYHLVVI